jgi:hypothetical protein
LAISFAAAMTFLTSGGASAGGIARPSEVSCAFDPEAAGALCGLERDAHAADLGSGEAAVDAEAELALEAADGAVGAAAEDAVDLGGEACLAQELLQCAHVGAALALAERAGVGRSGDEQHGHQHGECTEQRVNDQANGNRHRHCGTTSLSGRCLRG